MNIRLIVFLLANALLIASCGGGDQELREAQKLAKEVTQDANGAISVRKRYIKSIEDYVVFTERMESLSVERAGGGGYQLRLRKWHCVEDGDDPCGPKGIPIEYLLDVGKINETLIYSQGVYQESNESGPAIQLKCLPDATCLKFDDYGEFGNYRSCKKRDCIARGETAKAANENLAGLQGPLRAVYGEEIIECANEETCDKIDTALEVMIALLQNGSPKAVKAANRKLAKSAKLITKNANSAVSRRYDEKSLFNIKVMGTAGLSFSGNDDPSTAIRRAQLVRRVCYDAKRLLSSEFDDRTRCSDKNAFLVTAAIDLRDVDPASIYVASPDENVEENGLTVEFRCRYDDGSARSPKRRKCIEYQGVNTVDGFKLCDEDLCDNQFANQLGGLVGLEQTAAAKRGLGSIDCRTRKQCDRSAQALRDMVATARDIRGPGNDETPDSPLYKAREIAFGMNEHLTGFTISTDVGAAQDYAVNVTEIAFRKPDKLFIYVKFLPKPDTDLKDERVSAEYGDIVIDLSRVEIGASLAGPKRNNETAFFAPVCEGAERCAKISLGAHESEGANWIIPARDEAAANAMKEDLRKIIALMEEADEETQQSDASADTPPVTISAAAGKFAELALSLEAATRDGQYKTYNPTTSENIIFRTLDVSVDGNGALLASLASCNLKGSADAAEEDIPTIKDDSEFCDLLFTWLPTSQLTHPWELDRESIRIQAFLQNGRAHDPLGILGAGLPPGVDKALLNSAESFAVIAQCKENRDCVSYDGGDIGTTFYLPCKDKLHCEEATNALREIVDATDIAKGKRAALIADYALIAYPIAAIASERDARKAATRVEKRLSETPFLMRGDDGWEYSVTFEEALFDPPGSLVFKTAYKSEGADEPATAGFGRTTIDLSQISPNTMAHASWGDALPHGVFFVCNRDPCVTETLGSRRYAHSDWLMDCETRENCEAIATDLRGLIAFAGKTHKGETDRMDDGGNAAPVAPVPRDDDPAPITAPNPTIHADLSRAERRQVDKFHRATFGGATYFSVTWGDATRLMQGRGVSVNNDGHLIVHRRACLALTPAGGAPGDECKRDTLFQDYDLAIELGRMNRSSIKAYRGGHHNSTGWVEAVCRKGEQCARFVHRGGQANSIMQSYGEVESIPQIRMPCAGRKNCNDAAKALRDLVKRAPKLENRKKKKRKGGDLVGTWTLHQPPNPDWVVEYRADGTYLFTNATAQVNGVYEAADGLFSTRAPDFGSEDFGAYRLLDENTLEMTGKFGRSVWKRRS